MDRSAKHRLTFTVFVAVLFLAAAAQAQIVVKASDTVNFKFGILIQPQLDELQDANGAYQQNLFIRRLRLLFGGQVAPNLTFFVETDSPNLGKTLSTGKNIQPTTYIQDAYAEYKFRDELMIDAGLFLPSVSHNGLQSAATLLPIDYGAYSFTHNAAEQNSAGRDTGVQARGFIAKKFEYRFGVEQGLRDAGAHNPFRTNLRLQYNFLDPETGFFYAGTYLGKKKVLSVGGGYDQQRDYKSYAIDGIFDQPVGPGVLTAQADYVRFDGGDFVKTLPKQDDLLLEAGYLIGNTHFEPILQYTNKNLSGASTGDEHRLYAGANYWFAGHNGNVKGAWTVIDRKGAPRKANEFTVQLQLFYF